VNLLKKIFLFLLLVLLAFPRIFSTVQEVFYAFSFSSAALVEDALVRGKIEVSPFKAEGSLQGEADEISVRMAPTALLTILSSVTGMRLNILMALPLSGLVLALLSFVLAKRFLRSKLLAIVYALLTSYEPTTILLTNQLFFISLGIIMFYLSLIVFLKFHEGKLDNRKYVFLLLMFFVVAYLSYYTAEFYIILFLIFLVLANLISRMRKWRLSIKGVGFLTLAFVLIFVGFDSAFYYYLGRARFDLVLEQVNYLLRSLTGARTSSVVHFHSQTIVVLEVALLLSILAPVGAYLLWLLIAPSRKRRVSAQKGFDYRILAFIAVALTGLASLFIYAPLGLFDFKHIYLVFPLLALFSVEHFLGNRLKTKTVIIILLLLVFMLKFGAYVSTEELGYGRRYFTAMSPSAKWSSGYITENRILTDTETGAILLAEFVQTQKVNNVPICLFNEHNANFLYNLSKANEFAIRNYNYLILTRRITEQLVCGGSWSKFGPVKNVFYQMDNWTYASRIYDGGDGVVYRLDIPQS